METAVADVADVALERQLGRVDADDDEPVGGVAVDTRPYVWLDVDAVDAAEGPEVDEHDLAAQRRQGQRSLLIQSVIPMSSGAGPRSSSDTFACRPPDGGGGRRVRPAARSGGPSTDTTPSPTGTSSPAIADQDGRRAPSPPGPRRGSTQTRSIVAATPWSSPMRDDPPAEHRDHADGEGAPVDVGDGDPASLDRRADEGRRHDDRSHQRADARRPDEADESTEDETPTRGRGRAVVPSAGRLVGDGCETGRPPVAAGAATQADDADDRAAITAERGLGRKRRVRSASPDVDARTIRSPPTAATNPTRIQPSRRAMAGRRCTGRIIGGRPAGRTATGS